MADRHVHRAIRDLVDEPRSAEEAARRMNAPLTDEERADALALHRWFVRRYPTVKERLAYVRRKHAEWTRVTVHGRRDG